MKITPRIFLSYARQDAKKVENLYQILSDVEFKPWMDTKDILPGETWKLSIQKAVRHSDFFLACLSANSVSKRGFLQTEIKDALDIWQEKLDDDIYLIPVRLEDCEVPGSLRKFQWVDLFEEEGRAKLIKAIQVGMERRMEGDKPLAHELTPLEPYPAHERPIPTEGGPRRVSSNVPTQVAILLESDIKEFTQAERDNFILMLSRSVNISPNQIRILRVAPGSVLVTLEMPEDAAQLLVSMYLVGEPVLRALRIVTVELQPERLPSDRIPFELIREIQRGNCVPVIGSGIAREADVGIPSAWELALMLVRECERMDPSYTHEKHQYDPLDKVAEDFIAVADSAPGGRGLAQLEEILRREVTETGKRPPEPGRSSYPFIANIPWQKAKGSLIITTNWDELLEDAVVRYTGQACDVIMEDTRLSRVEEDHARIKIVKLHGTISQPETIVVTQGDYDLKKNLKAVRLFEYVGNLLATRTILFAGYSLRDSNFRFLYTLVEEATERTGISYTPTHYAILSEEPDPNDRAQWEKRGIVFLRLTAREFFRQVFIETNEFINRDEQRRLHRLEYAPLYALIGPAGVGKSTLLRRINDDLDLERSEQVRHYKYHLFYRFPRPEPLTPESRCLDLLGRVAKELNYPLPDIVREAKRRASEEGRPEQVIRQKMINDHLDRLRLKFVESTLLLFDCTTRLNPGIVRFLERLLEPALGASGLHAIIASRYPIEWSRPDLRRVFRSNTERLRPFTEINVANWLQYQALLEADTLLEPDTSREAGRKITRLTRGHPGAIKRVMSRLSEDATRLQDGQRITAFIEAGERELVEDIVHEVVEKQILSDGEEILRKILSDLLCVFRKINPNVLEALVDFAPDQPTKEVLQKRRVELMASIMTYYLAAEPSTEENPSPMYALDPVLRRLLAHHLELRDQERFIELDDLAAHLFEEWASLWADDWQRTAILESLYHWLPLAHATGGDLEAQFQKYANRVSTFLNRLQSSAGVSAYPDLVQQLRNQLEADQELADDFIALFGSDRYARLLSMIQ